VPDERAFVVQFPSYDDEQPGHMVARCDRFIGLLRTENGWAFIAADDRTVWLDDITQSRPFDEVAGEVVFTALARWAGEERPPQDDA